MRPSTWLNVIAAASLGVGSISWLGTQAIHAVEVRGQTYFTHPPLLVDATTTYNTVAVSYPTYYFTLSIPEDAGEPLGEVVITQQDGETASRLVRYDTEETRAFVGTTRDRGEEIAIAETQFDRDTQSVAVRFATPIPPGTIVTIGLEPTRNPRLSGVYLFGVTALPAGASPYRQFLGYGRLQFYDRSDGIFPLSW